MSTGPLLGLLSAHDEHPDQWSYLVLRDLLVISTSEFGLEAKLGDPGNQWPAYMILRPAKWKTMLAKARTEDWWNDPSDELDEDTLECGNIDRSGVPVAFTVEQSTCPECGKIFKKGPKAVATHRMRAHGHRKPVSSYIESEECPGCNKHFPNRSKLLDYAQYRSKGCRDKILLLRS